MAYYYNSIQTHQTINYCPVPGSITSGQYMVRTDHRSLHSSYYATTVSSVSHHVTTQNTSPMRVSVPQYVPTPAVHEESAQMLADEIITTYIADLPNRHWLGKLLHESIPCNLESDKHLIKFSRRIWQRLCDMDDTQTTLSFYIMANSHGKEQLERFSRHMTKIWNKFKEVVYESGEICVRVYPGVVRSRTMSHERILKYFLLESCRKQHLLQRWDLLEEQLTRVIANAQSFIQDLPPPKSPTDCDDVMSTI